jgi:hypothetical protein
VIEVKQCAFFDEFKGSFKLCLFFLTQFSVNSGVVGDDCVFQWASRLSYSNYIDVSKFIHLLSPTHYKTVTSKFSSTSVTDSVSINAGKLHTKFFQCFDSMLFMQTENYLESSDYI